NTSINSEEEGPGLDPGKFPPIEEVEPESNRQAPWLNQADLAKAMAGCKLNKHWRRRLICLLWEFMDVFDGTNLGNCGICPHEIDTGDVAPISQRPFPTSPRLRAVIETQVQDMLEKGVIRVSDSPWSAGLVVVTKADGTPRVCVDFRMLNSVTRGPDRFPLPKIDDMINKLRNAQFFTCLDLLSGFWQQAMDPKSIEKTSFVTQDAQYEFTRMPFGLKNAGS
ncbi:MAG: RNA-directed DNA polymerase, partial [Gammaproteobacteria bacterium]|nr:RNA-directed DNA polymerase [Gammaproteobacteria bacterium]